MGDEGVVMKAPKMHSNSEQRQRISDELRQLKLMSKGLRTRALRALMERHAGQRLEPKAALLPAKTTSSVAA
jgi:hypothetical protein